MLPIMRSWHMIASWHAYFLRFVRAEQFCVNWMACVHVFLVKHLRYEKPGISAGMSCMGSPVMGKNRSAWASESQRDEWLSRWEAEELSVCADVWVCGTPRAGWNFSEEYLLFLFENREKYKNRPKYENVILQNIKQTKVCINRSKQTEVCKILK